MKTKKLTLISLSLLAGIGLFLSSCTKDNGSTEQVRIIDRPNISRTINYTVLVVAGETSSTSGGTYKSAVQTKGATGAKVTVSVNGSVLNKTTDASGQATFSNLTAGLAAVTVVLEGHTTVNYVVNLYHIDTLHYDNEKSRIVSTKVVVFPTTGTGMITISGLVKIQSNIEVTFATYATNDAPYTQSPELENAPSGTVITATIPNSEFSKYVTMIDGGTLTDVTYEGVTFTGTVDASGNYSISVPSTAMNLAIKLMPPQIATDLTYSIKLYNTTDGTDQINATTNNHILGTRTARYIFSAPTYNVTANTSINVIQDITYNNPVVTDPDFFSPDNAYMP